MRTQMRKRKQHLSRSESEDNLKDFEDPPLPIPNREVKLTIADGTDPPVGRVGSCRSSGPLRVLRLPGVFFLCLRENLLHRLLPENDIFSWLLAPLGKDKFLTFRILLFYCGAGPQSFFAPAPFRATRRVFRSTAGYGHCSDRPITQFPCLQKGVSWHGMSISSVPVLQRVAFVAQYV